MSRKRKVRSKRAKERANDRMTASPVGQRSTSREHQEHLQLLIDSVEDYAIFMLDPDGRVATWNPGAEKFNGYKAVEIIGRHFSCFYPDEDVRLLKPQTELRIAAERGRVEDEGWRVRKDGSRFWANA